MSNKSLIFTIIIVIAIILVVIGVTTFKSGAEPEVPTPAVQNDADSGLQDSATTQTPALTSSSTPTTGSQPITKSYTLAQVAAHATAQSCWTTIDGSVYDLSEWIAKHSGGAEAIMKLCGKDGTTTFNNQHGGQEKQATQLATFKIGVLVQ